MDKVDFGGLEYHLKLFFHVSTNGFIDSYLGRFEMPIFPLILVYMCMSILDNLFANRYAHSGFHT